MHPQDQNDCWRRCLAVTLGAIVRNSWSGRCVPMTSPAEPLSSTQQRHHENCYYDTMPTPLWVGVVVVVVVQRNTRGCSVVVCLFASSGVDPFHHYDD